MKIIATIRTKYKEKFGIPRQSGIVDTEGLIVFEPEYRAREALRGLEEFSHLWLIWEFSENKEAPWHPTVRPPRLGGTRRMGVFATRSPRRPNPIGLSCVRLLGIEDTKDGPVLRVSGADLLDKTPIYDIKPYLPYTDSHPEAVGGFADRVRDYAVRVEFPAEISENIDEQTKEELISILAHDPRPSYQDDDSRIYGLTFGNYEVRFRYDADCIIVIEIK